jgi:hypothetical protein
MDEVLQPNGMWALLLALYEVATANPDQGPNQGHSGFLIIRT